MSSKIIKRRATIPKERTNTSTVQAPPTLNKLKMLEITDTYRAYEEYMKNYNPNLDYHIGPSKGDYMTKEEYALAVLNYNTLIKANRLLNGFGLEGADPELAMGNFRAALDLTVGQWAQPMAGAVITVGGFPEVGVPLITGFGVDLMTKSMTGRDFGDYMAVKTKMVDSKGDPKPIPAFLWGILNPGYIPLEAMRGTKYALEGVANQLTAENIGRYMAIPENGRYALIGRPRINRPRVLASDGGSYVGHSVYTPRYPSQWEIANFKKGIFGKYDNRTPVEIDPMDLVNFKHRNMYSGIEKNLDYLHVFTHPYHPLLMDFLRALAEYDGVYSKYLDNTYMGIGAWSKKPITTAHVEPVTVKGKKIAGIYADEDRPVTLGRLGYAYGYHTAGAVKNWDVYKTVPIKPRGANVPSEVTMRNLSKGVQGELFPNFIRGVMGNAYDASYEGWALYVKQLPDWRIKQIFQKVHGKNYGDLLTNVDPELLRAMLYHFKKGGKMKNPDL